MHSQFKANLGYVAKNQTRLKRWPQVKELAAKPDNSTSIPGVHMVKRENQFLQVVI